jgi:hypothetical protein
MFIDPGPPRPENQWSALVTDFVAPTHKSDWGRRVTDRRIAAYDRVRPYATRAFLLVALVAELSFISDCSPIAFVFLIPAMIQVTLEIALEPTVNADVVTAERAWPIARPVVDLFVRNYERIPVNATGLIGTVAVITNIAAVLFFSGTDGPGWLRVIAFATAVLYCCSGTLGPVIDTPWYSPLDKTPPTLRRLMPFAWCLVLAILLTAVVVADQTVGPWADDSLPYALAVCGLSYYIGLRAREYERDLGAAAVVMAMAHAEEQKFIAQEMHDRFQPAKYGLERVIESVDLGSDQRSALRNFLYDMNDLYRPARDGSFTVGSAFRPAIRNRVHQICESARMGYPDSVFDLEDKVDHDNYRLALNVVTTLCHNTKQAYERTFETAYERDLEIDIDMNVHVEMTLEDAMASVVVSDHLDLIADEVWERDDTTLARIAGTLRARGGCLTQSPTTTGKSIRAVWNVHLQPVREANHHAGMGA